MMALTSQPSPLANDCDHDFQQAVDGFMDQLSDQEKKSFKRHQNASEFLEDFRKLGQSTKNKKFNSVFRGIKQFSDGLSPYFDALGIIVQSHPEWTAIAWGTFRLVLQVIRKP